jgi:mannobiose 2-epimerase
MKDELKRYKEEVEAEHASILTYWLKHTIDKERGGFYGRIDQDNKVYPDAPKGAILNGRILWSFSAGYHHSPKKEYLDAAHRAFDYITKNLFDRKYGGVYWTVTADGKPLETRKHLYANAFILYGLSEYYRASRNESAKHEAIALYSTMLQHGYDKEYGGYFEGFTREWKDSAEERLSLSEANEKKSMNTSLHVIEALANLYSVWPDNKLREQVKELLIVFADKIIDPQTGHQKLFFDRRWNMIPPVILSYGHDIEAAWLLLETAMIIKDQQMIDRYKDISMKLAVAGRKGLDTDGGLWYEYHVADKSMNKQKHWWPQSEAMVGFFNAWQISGNENYLKDSLLTWNFIKQHIIDKEHGEWLSAVDNDGSSMGKHDKVGLWKCPYHNSRACLEISKRIASLPA